MSLQMVKNVGVGRFLNWALVDARGAAGDLLLFWDNRVLENLEVESGGGGVGYSIFVRFRNCADDFSWIFYGVYGPVIGGDFNAIRFPEERRNAPRLTAEMRRFSEMIGELGLRDFPLAGGYNSHCIAEKLKVLNKEVVGNVSFNRVEAFSCLQRWETKENENSLSPGEAEAKNLALEDYKKWALLE
ncbi:hypothetical protein CK203_088455 [Vitis vinifera]|uniref:Endonuclease/exonuclease/phosphatase domain-containing protein n=1 Tax=Vitis vinifera TaxID=29760 RepID=A0A438ELQ3_VITVI|nr:hypothetical protein CK203_088455 [Vitis vinifera]